MDGASWGAQGSLTQREAHVHSWPPWGHRHSGFPGSVGSLLPPVDLLQDPLFWGVNHWG